jgi:hypothetical protein
MLRAVIVPPFAATPSRAIASPSPGRYDPCPVARRLQTGPRVAGQAAAFVLDLDEDTTFVCVRLHEDVARGARELEGVLQQVGDRRRQRVPVDSSRTPCGTGVMVSCRPRTFASIIAATSTSSMNSASGSSLPVS